MVDILLDCDGVLADFVTPAFEIANGITGKNLHPDELDRWDIADFFGLDKKQETNFYECMKSQGFARHNLVPYPEAKKAVEKLKTLGHVHIVTSPMHSRTWCYDRWEWLAHHFDIHRRNVIHADQKHLVTGDFFLDDKPENVRAWKERHHLGWGFLLDRPFNRSTDMNRVSWAEFVTLVEARVATRLHK